MVTSLAAVLVGVFALAVGLVVGLLMGLALGRRRARHELAGASAVALFLAKPNAEQIEQARAELRADPRNQKLRRRVLALLGHGGTE